LRIINLTSDIATIEPANGSTLTNAAGVAEFTLTAGSTLGAGTVTASFANDNASLIETKVLESVSAESESALSIVILGADGNASNTLKEDNPLTVRVSIVDLDGAIQNVDDEIITLASDLGTVAPANGSALTDDGVAEFTLEFNGTVGAGAVTATYATAQGDLQLTENLEAQTDADSLFVLSMSRSTGSLTPSNPVTVTVNLRSSSASGPAVAGELVSLTSQISDITRVMARPSLTLQAMPLLHFNTMASMAPVL
jgi:methionine-rich copper-binding protein CopC